VAEHRARATPGPARRGGGVMAQVLRLPGRVESQAESPATAPAPPAWARGTVDGWGRDDQLVRALSPLLRARWAVSVGGERHVPAAGGGLLVTNTRRLSLSAVYVAWALGEAVGRPVRFAGRPDVAPVGPLLRRLGGLLDDPREVRCALRDGELVVATASATAHPRHAGAVHHDLIGAALAAGVQVLPVASTSAAFARGARVEVGAPVRLRRARRGPLAEVELALAVQRALQTMLDELGGVGAGVSAIDWLGEG